MVPASPSPAPAPVAPPRVEPLLLSTARVSTFLGPQLLTAATGFFFRRDERLFLITSRHVLFDKPTAHLPDRIQVVVHVDPTLLTRTALVSLPLYREARATWRQGCDSSGEIDVAAIEIDRALMPPGALFCSFGPENLQSALAEIEVGTQLLLPAFPLGFYDTVHYLPVVRHAIIASSFGVRFQGQGYFLTDARTHRGSSGAPVVMRDDSLGPQMPWRLLGVHSARMDMGTRDLQQDESLGLNTTWYADVLMTLTAQPVPAAVAETREGAASRREPPRRPPPADLAP
jgi:hypothetical protein